VVLLWADINIFDATCLNVLQGLIMNFLHTFYPSLLKIPGFLLEFITPIVKVC
jgi:hypothetical protein